MEISVIHICYATVLPSSPQPRGCGVNDTEATGRQVAEELKNMAEGIAPLCVVLAGVITIALLEELKDGRQG
jgi:hypothetical protein